MRYRRGFFLAALLVAISGVTYSMVGIYVRNTSNKTVQYAVWCMRGGEPTRCRDTLRWLLWFEPNHPEALHVTGLSYLREQNLAAAIANFDRVAENSPVYLDAQINMAGALLADQQLERAESALRHQLTHNPQSLLVVRFLSGLFLTELRQRDAVDILEKFLSRTADHEMPLTDRLTILRDLSTAEFHPPPAQACYPTLKQSLQKHPNQPSVCLSLGQCEWSAGHTEDAARLLSQALEQRPHDQRFRFVTAQFLLETGNLKAAEEILRTSSENRLPPADGAQSVIEQDDQYWSLKCQVAEQSKEYGQAITCMDRAIAIRPTEKEYATRRARLLQRANREDEARAAYSRSHDLAKVELDLWNLSRELGVRLPTEAECEQMAQGYEFLGKSLQAEAWRRLPSHIEQNATTGSNSP